MVRIMFWVFCGLRPHGFDLIVILCSPQSQLVIYWYLNLSYRFNLNDHNLLTRLQKNDIPNGTDLTRKVRQHSTLWEAKPEVTFVNLKKYGKSPPKNSSLYRI